MPTRKIAINGIVRTYDIIEEIEKIGLDLGVADARKSTAISNILLRTGKFKRVDSGVYRVPNENNDETQSWIS